MATHDSAPGAEVKFSTHCIIGGRPQPARDGVTFPSINPSTGKVLAHIAKGGAAEVDAAVTAARKAFDEGAWPRLSPAMRKTHLLRFAALVEAHIDELAQLEVLEAGKPVSDCINIDLPETVSTLRWHAEAADKIYDQVSPSGPGVLSLVVREPVGVVGVVLPWNFPLMMAAWKLGPILASGNTAVLKPAEQTSLSTIRLAELAVEAGIPDGVVNVVPGFGESAGKALGLLNGVDCIGFTGSTDTGRLFLNYAAESNLKRVLLECGGKNPMVVMPDARDLDSVAAHAVNSVFWNMGENCSSNSRLLVHASLKEELLGLVVEKTHDWVVGDPLDTATRVGPMIEESHMKKVLEHIRAAKESGAELVAGGGRVREDSGGFFIAPTVFDKVTSGMRIAREEVFGPVLAVSVFDTPEQGIALANDTDYGLAASVFTASNQTAHNAARAIRAGTVAVNCYAEGDAATPFGGYKLSGFGGRDKSLAAHEQYCELKTIWMDLS